jgi:hypothetical protein
VAEQLPDSVLYFMLWRVHILAPKSDRFSLDLLVLWTVDEVETDTCFQREH